MPKTKKTRRTRARSGAPYPSRQQIQFARFKEQLDKLDQVNADQLSCFDVYLHKCMCAVVAKLYPDKYIDRRSYESIVAGLQKKSLNQQDMCKTRPITLNFFVLLLKGENKELARSVMEVMVKFVMVFLVKRLDFKKAAIDCVLWHSLPAMMSWCAKEEVNDKEEAGLFWRGVAIIVIVSSDVCKGEVPAWMVDFFEKHRNASASRFLNNFDQCLKKMTDDQKEKKSFLCLTKFHDKLKGDLQRAGLLEEVSDSSGRSNLPQSVLRRRKQSGARVVTEGAGTNLLGGDDLAGLLKGMTF